MYTLGTRLRMARERRGLSQVEVARQTGYNNKSLSRWERDEATADPDVLRRLVKLYDISPEFMLGLTDVMNSWGDGGSSKTPPAILCDPKVVDDLNGLTPEEQLKVREYMAMLKSYRSRK